MLTTLCILGDDLLQKTRVIRGRRGRDGQQSGLLVGVRRLPDRIVDLMC